MLAEWQDPRTGDVWTYDVPDLSAITVEVDEDKPVLYGPDGEPLTQPKPFGFC